MLRPVLILSTAVIAATLTLKGMIAAHALPAPATTPAVMQVATPAAITHHAGAAQVAKGRDGQFWAEALVDGRQVRFLVDTGATAVALTRTDALRLSLKPEDLNFNQTVMTAAGPSRAAMVDLPYVAVAGARVEHVSALVLDRGLESSLLGMSYLGRLSRFEATPNALILRP